MEVQFDFDGRRKVVRNTTLKVVNNDTETPIDEVDKAVQDEVATIPTTVPTNESSGDAPSNLKMVHFLFLIVSNCFY